MLDAVAKMSTVQSILDVLRREILSTMKPGDLLPNERALAARFQVGRNTVREALIFLEAYGLVEKTQRGARVTEADRDFDHVLGALDGGLDRSLATHRDLVEFRRFIEMGAFERILERIDDKSIDALERILDRMERALTPSEAAQADYDFHALLIEIAGNSVLRRLYRVMAATLVYYMEIGKERNGPETIRRHRRIVEALRRRAPAELEAAARAHYAFSEKVLDQEFSRDPSVSG